MRIITKIEKWELKHGVPKHWVYIGAILILALIIILPPYPFP